MAYESKFKRDDIDELFDAVLTLEDREDCYRFFEDICTINEIHAIAQRLQVAKLLSEKKTAYSEYKKIKKEMRDYQIAKQNVESFYAAQKTWDQEKDLKKKRQQQR